MLTLSLTEKGGSTNELSFDKDEVSVGRVRGNDIVLPKGNVSKHHCRLMVRNGELFVEDLHSTNGTYVNGRKIAEPVPVSTTDKVFIGDFIIRVNSLTSSLEMMRPGQLSGPPEAGSLSSAIPRRPPPPPPSMHGGGLMDEGMGSSPKSPHGSSRAPLPPPPPPPMPVKRESRVAPVVSDAFPPPPSGPSDISLDDEDDVLGTPKPHITVPPLKPAVQPDSPLSDADTPHPDDDMPATPPPAQEPAAARMTMHDASLPSDSSEASDDLMGEQAGEPPSPDDLAPTSAPSSPSIAAPAGKPHATRSTESPKGKHATASSRAGGRSVDRDVPEWLTHLLDGEGVSAAFFTGTNQVELLRNGKRESASVPAGDLAGLGAVVRKLAGKGSPRPDSDAMTINTSLADGMHISAIFPPVADRLCVAIRRPVATSKTIEDMVDDKVISPEMRQLLDACVASRQNILISGDRAACDSILRAMLWSVDRVARVVLVSEAITPPASATAWLKLQPGLLSEGLVSAAVAMQPEYLVVDAAHSGLLPEILSECSLGLEGAVLSLVARSTGDALHRLQMLASTQASASAMAGDMVLSGIDVVVQATVLADGSLKVVEIAEPKASLDGQVSAHALLTWIPGDDGSGSFTATGARSALAAKLASAGAAVPQEILNRQ
jgi:pilus assembly protein CpaF